MVTDRRDLIAGLVDAGRPLPEIEREAIDTAGWLDDDERAALWLFAWAYQNTRGGTDGPLTGGRGSLASGLDATYS